MIEKASTNQLLFNLSVLISQPTGITTYAANLLPYLKTVELTLLASQPYSTFNYCLIPANLTPEYGTRGHLRRLLWTQFKLPQIYQELKGSLLFSPVPEAPINAGCRSVVMVHDLIPLRFPRRFSPQIPYFRYYIPQVLSQAEHIICNSSATAADLVTFYKIPASKITPISLAYDSNHFRPLNQERENNPPYFLYLGRCDLYKNLHRLLQAFSKLPQGGDYQLWFAGPYDRRYTPKLQQQASELGVTHLVKFLNYVPYKQLPRIINEAVALVFPTLWEGFGLPILEAMACGTPVITSNLASMPEVAGNAALLIDPYKTTEITAAMQAIAEDTILRSRLKTLGIQRASQFSWSRTGKATVEVLQKYL